MKTQETAPQSTGLVLFYSYVLVGFYSCLELICLVVLLMDALTGGFSSNGLLALFLASAFSPLFIQAVRAFWRGLDKTNK